VAGGRAASSFKIMYFTDIQRLALKFKKISGPIEIREQFVYNMTSKKHSSCEVSVVGQKKKRK
jgi:hypothetical protein